MRQTLRQIVAVLALGGIALSLVPSALAATYTDLSAANKLAASGYIVDQSATPAAYRLGDTLLRQEGIKVAGRALGIIPATLDASAPCTSRYSDVTEKWVCQITELAAKAGLTVTVGKFRPHDTLSKYEAMALAFRSACTATPNGGTVAGLGAQAASAGIITNAASWNGTAAVTRGEFFKYVSTAMEDSTCGDTTSPDVLCTLFPDLCVDNGGGTGGGTVTPTGGAVDVSLGTSLADGTQVPMAGTVKFATVDFTTGSRDVALNTVNISKVALATIPTTTRIWFELDGKRVSGKAAFSSDGKAVISFAPAYLVKANTTASLDLYVELATTAGNDFQFKGTLATSTADSITGDFTTPKLRTADYTVAPVTYNTAGADTSVNLSTDPVELGRFTLTNMDTSPDTRDVAFQTITLRQLGTGDLADLSDITLERNGVKVSTEATTNGKDLMFTINDTVKDGAIATYYIKANVTGVQNNAGDTYNFTLRNSSDLNAVEAATGFRSTVTPTVSALHTTTINGADLVMARDTSVDLASSYAKGTPDVVLAQGTISAKSPITLEDIYLNYTTNAGLNTDAFKAFDTIYLQIGSSVMTWTAPLPVPPATTVVGQAQFLGLATVDGTVKYKIWAKIKDTATLTSFKFASFDLSSVYTRAEYVSNQNVVNTGVGSIPAVQLSIDTGALSVTRTDGLGNTNIAVGSTGVVANGLSLAVNTGNNLVISNPVYTVTATGAYTNNVTATLYVDGTAVSTKTINGATVSFNTNQTITKTPKTMVVKVDFADAYAPTGPIPTPTFSMKLTGLDITDSLTSATIALGSVPSSVTYTLAAATGTASISDANPKASLLLAGSKDQKILAFRVKAANDNVKLRDVTIIGTTIGNLSNFRLLTPTANYIPATSNDASSVTFSNISTTDTILKDKTDTYYLVADVNTNVAVDTFSATLDVSASTVKATNGTITALAGSDIVGNTHKILENSAVIAKGTNSSKDLVTSALRFTVTAAGKDNVTLNSATFANIFSGYTLTNAKVTVYKDSISASNKLNLVTTATATSNATGTTATIVNGGAGYVAVPAVTVTTGQANVTATATSNAAGTVATLTNAGGGGYVTVPAVTVSGGTCATLPTAVATIAGGVVTGITLSGAVTCTVAPTLTVAAPTSTLPTATATVV